MEFDLNVSGRELKGTSNAKKLRKQGLIPGIVYGHGEKTKPILIPIQDLDLLLKKVSHDVVIVKLSIDSTWKKRCILKSIQVDPLTDKPNHADFQILKKEAITIKVPVILNGEAPGVKAGGILDHNMRELHVKVLPDKIPEHVEIDISDLEMGHAIHISDLKYEDLEFLDPPDTPIVSVIVPKKIEVAEVAPVAVEEGVEVEEEVKEEEKPEEAEKKETTKEETKS